MDVDPMEHVEAAEEDAPKASSPEEQRRSRLNARVAVTVALLATFMGICQVKDGNVAQAMAQAQAKSNDYWAWYQFRKVRSDLFQAMADQFRLEALSAPAAARATYSRQAVAYQSKAKEQQAEMKKTQKEAESQDRQYDALNLHDDQFDLSDALLSVAIALLALTSLTQKPWLYILSMLPTSLGVVMGLAGLLNWNLELEALTKLLS